MIKSNWKAVRTAITKEGELLTIEFQGGGVNYMSSTRHAQHWYETIFLEQEIKDLRRLNLFLSEELRDLRDTYCNKLTENVENSNKLSKISEAWKAGYTDSDAIQNIKEILGDK